LIAPLPDFVVAQSLDAMLTETNNPANPVRGVYNLCATDAHTPFEVAYMIAKATGMQDATS